MQEIILRIKQSNKRYHTKEWYLLEFHTQTLSLNNSFNKVKQT